VAAVRKRAHSSVLPKRLPPPATQAFCRISRGCVRKKLNCDHNACNSAFSTQPAKSINCSASHAFNSRTLPLGEGALSGVTPSAEDAEALALPLPLPLPAALLPCCCGFDGVRSGEGGRAAWSRLSNSTPECRASPRRGGGERLAGEARFRRRATGDSDLQAPLSPSAAPPTPLRECGALREA